MYPTAKNQNQTKTRCNTTLATPYKHVNWTIARSPSETYEYIQRKRMLTDDRNVRSHRLSNVSWTIRIGIPQPYYYTKQKKDQRVRLLSDSRNYDMFTENNTYCLRPDALTDNDNNDSLHQTLKRPVTSI